ncbi:MAG: L,D-transpeptidase, partial [Polyangiaceae bacterium]|nr:L,D-transpeptidase [Polyangiaceae bacterium]
MPEVAPAPAATTPPTGERSTPEQARAHATRPAAGVPGPALVAPAVAPADDADEEPEGAAALEAATAGLEAAAALDERDPTGALDAADTRAEGSGAEDEAGPRTDPASPRLYSTARETWVFAEPRWSSRKLGYLRAGASVERKGEPLGRANCRGGWHRIAPKGYVCAGPTASPDPSAPVAVLAQKRPATDGLPYLYVTSRYPVPPLYARLPTLAQQRTVEPTLEGHLRKAAMLALDPDFVPPPPPDPLPEAVASGAVLPGTNGAERSPEQLLAGTAKIRSGFALLATYDHEGRRFGLTTDLTLLPLDRARVVAQSKFHGIALSESDGLPVAFVKARHAQRFRLDEAGRFAADGPFAWREALGLTGQRRRASGFELVETRAGGWVRADDVLVVERFTHAPRWAKPGVKWIDVSLLHQRLVAYEGEKPVYATLVSTGAGGIGDPKKTHATVQGAFLVHTKHVSVTMDGDEAGDEFDLRDVPFVQYFTQGYALHAAYWHDDFGRARSHGCVNLAPIDAAWLFGWTTPGVPEGWHAAMSL